MYKVSEKIMLLCSVLFILEKEKRESGEVVRDTKLEGVGWTLMCPVLKVPRQSPLVLLIEIMNMIGN
jgi:hypothetical protein